ncbi:uncharacterized protein [Diabrotica undecimpunctata]|uniref:uncharacterized protein n=1 Tax=Diabrotica undecimpunctata TaxID=50387 RepID=UPI003B631A52
MERLFMCGLNKDARWILKYIYLPPVILFEGHVLWCFISVIRSTGELKSVIPFLGFMSLYQPGVVSICLTLYYLESAVASFDEIRSISRNLCLQNKKFEDTVDKEAKSIVTFAYFLLLFSLVCHIQFLKPFFNNQDVQPNSWIINKYYNEYLGYAVMIATYCSHTIAAIAILGPTNYLLNFSFHVTFQMKWLGEQIVSCLAQSDKSMSNDDYQKYIQKNITDIVKHHVRFIRVFKTISEFQDLGILLCSISALVMSIGTIFFIFTDIDPSCDRQMYTALVLMATIVCSLSIASQKLTDATEELWFLLYNCPWTNWSTNNKKLLLIILPCIKEPLEVSMYAFYPLNIKFISKGARILYSLAAAFLNRRL